LPVLFDFVVEEIDHPHVERKRKALNVVQRYAVFRILDIADLVLRKISRMSQLFLAHILSKTDPTHISRQDQPRSANVPPCHLAR
jgi:hypothetical protein